MKRLFIWLLWAVIIVSSCVAADQLLMNYSLDAPAYRAAQTFYKDFRGRIILLAKKDDLRLEGVKKDWSPTLPPAMLKKIEPLLQHEVEPGGYVYTDKAGGLHLTTRLADVPKEYRATAKPLQK
ncbi:MAG: hypothetical protein CVU69_04795 [Deltaproteobacteria bacterium HGW-Deltaproteobacteria-4]|nr:MAG: hypothetical protein CVU69_04795 [Deltaproteobacteria bacterium HGW-Deltaproteobacteria-4]